ncbi:Asp-tRNA(Asn)/Glu-tRNA(Gln) amidotransferase subunit GatB [Olsenella intestinalis]|uniref:Asp-tRNA(Asn)/Glu-tRNA(Gln) amidotransferase subunit GatB n=1 Tax=Olsenella intestinalis TaxID=2930083 RepID=UPI00200C1B05|nr:Asp-tRNA(Asn)/Glu-tRNA(Gln) amidotransferase subunit GatB [Olsenella intestinalis]
MSERIQDILSRWQASIGLEVHVELTSLETKLLCGCTLSRNAEPNTHVCPVCLGLPGALPVANREAVLAVARTGLALGCAVERRSTFWRKHYFYPDMAKNFQTTQGPVAICMGGSVEVELDAETARERPDAPTLRPAPDGGYVTRIRIRRIHLEEDAAKMVHVGGAEGRIAGATHSLIDYNRAGTPLMELVCEPDLRTPAEARRLVEHLRQTLLALGVSDCSLEAGSLRVDANVSLARAHAPELGTKCEMKNLNSLKSLHDALAFEVRRQAALLDAGKAVRQQTRHWEPTSRRTIALRTKEAFDDYRLFPDPDLPPILISDDVVERLRASLPELPAEKSARYVSQLGLRRREARMIAADPALASLFEAALAVTPETPATPEAPATPARDLATTVANVIVNLRPAHGCLAAAQVRSIAQLLHDEALTFAQARDVIDAVAPTGEDPARYVDAHGLRQNSDREELASVVDDVLARSEDQVAQYRAGNTKVVGHLIGQCMREAGAAGNPKLFSALLRERLDAQGA